MISQKQILKLKKILEKEHGREFSFEEASRIGNGLVRLYSNLADNNLGIGHLPDCPHCKQLKTTTRPIAPARRRVRKS